MAWCRKAGKYVKFTSLVDDKGIVLQCPITGAAKDCKKCEKAPINKGVKEVAHAACELR
jgi:hypothetical protein